MRRPVERSITVSAPHFSAQASFSTSSSIDELTAELPMLALILVEKRRPITIGSSSRWRRLAGTMARPAATSARTSSGSTRSRRAANSISSVITPRRAK
jgi:hypothetical protein